MNWTNIDVQGDLQRLDESVCWEDTTVLEYYATSALAPGLPSDVSRSGYVHPNLYVLLDAACGADLPWLELALMHCDRIGADALSRLHLGGRVDTLRRVEVVSHDGSVLLRCARLAYRRLPESDRDGRFYTRAEYWLDAPAT
jgi:hypothetical protein